MLRNKTILITGGTGSFGQKFTEVCIRKHKPKKLSYLAEVNLINMKCKKNFQETRLRN